MWLYEVAPDIKRLENIIPPVVRSTLLTNNEQKEVGLTITSFGRNIPLEYFHKVNIVAPKITDYGLLTNVDIT